MIFCTAPLPRPAKVTGMDESASHTPPSHSTSSFSTLTINSQPLFLSLYSLPLSFFNPPRFSLSLCLSDSHLPSLSLLSHSLVHHMGIIFLEIQKETTAVGDTGVPRRHRESNADLNSQLTSYSLLFFFFFAREELQRAVGEAGVWSLGEHQRTSRNTRTSTHA